jgi:hypothetical protein
MHHGIVTTPPLAKTKPGPDLVSLRTHATPLPNTLAASSLKIVAKNYFILLLFVM